MDSSLLLLSGLAGPALSGRFSGRLSSRLASAAPIVGAAAYALYTHREALLERLTASVKISRPDPLLDAMKNWLEKQAMDSTILTASSMTAQSYDRIRMAGKDPEIEDPRAGSGSIMKFTPSGNVTFTFRGRKFWYTEKTATRNEQDGPTNSVSEITIHCYGLSTSPIQNLLQHVYQVANIENKYTHILTPQTGHFWEETNGKPIRPLDTIDLEGSLRDEIVADIAKFLDVETKKRYIKKGQPYRRGYLLEGPPGTGKSSIAAAIAGHFGLKVHVLNLTDPYMHDSSFASLIQLAGPKSMILIEDIDSAGLKREGAEKTKPNGRPATRVTLAGFLNAIDGVSAPEGHILFMSSNNAGVLDEAMVRPGRVDRQFKLDNATQEQARKIFLRLYDGECDIGLFSEAFAAKIPDRQISPAEIQGYIQLRADEPWRAVDDVGSFVAQTLEAKKMREEKAGSAKKAQSQRSGPANLEKAPDDSPEDEGSEDKPSEDKPSQDKLSEDNPSDGGNADHENAVNEAADDNDSDDEDLDEDSDDEDSDDEDFDDDLDYCYGRS